jgi:hypothetical protein
MTDAGDHGKCRRRLSLAGQARVDDKVCDKNHEDPQKRAATCGGAWQGTFVVDFGSRSDGWNCPSKPLLSFNSAKSSSYQTGPTPRVSESFAPFSSRRPPPSFIVNGATRSAAVQGPGHLAFSTASGKCACVFPSFRLSSSRKLRCDKPFCHEGRFRVCLLLGLPNSSSTADRCEQRKVDC